jgi:hypothetical protein
LALDLRPISKSEGDPSGFVHAARANRKNKININNNKTLGISSSSYQINSLMDHSIKPYSFASSSILLFMVFSCSLPKAIARSPAYTNS